MLASEFIQRLDALIKEHGDLPVVDPDDNQVDVELVDNEVFVVE